MIDRINYLAKKSKSEVGLNKEEIIEQKKLREEYIKGFRRNFKEQLNSIEIVD